MLVHISLLLPALQCYIQARADSTHFSDDERPPCSPIRPMDTTERKWPEEEAMEERKEKKKKTHVSSLYSCGLADVPSSIFFAP